MKKILILLISSFLFFGCHFSNSDTSNKNIVIIDCPPAIANRALYFAQLYSNTNIPYEFGGQSPLRSAGIDCSGLVIMCYKYALVDTNYSLLLPDMSTAYMYDNAVTHTDINNLRAGDLIFFTNDNIINHMGIFSRIENNCVYFYDSTQLNASNVNGVTLRNYPLTDARIEGGGVMRIVFN